MSNQERDRDERDGPVHRLRDDAVSDVHEDAVGRDKASRDRHGKRHERENARVEIRNRCAAVSDPLTGPGVARPDSCGEH